MDTPPGFLALFGLKGDDANYVKEFAKRDSTFASILKTALENQLENQRPPKSSIARNGPLKEKSTPVSKESRRQVPGNGVVAETRPPKAPTTINDGPMSSPHHSVVTRPIWGTVTQNQPHLTPAHINNGINASPHQGALAQLPGNGVVAQNQLPKKLELAQTPASTNGSNSSSHPGVLTRAKARLLSSSPATQEPSPTRLSNNGGVTKPKPRSILAKKLYGKENSPPKAVRFDKNATEIARPPASVVTRGPRVRRVTRTSGSGVSKRVSEPEYPNLNRMALKEGVQSTVVGESNADNVAEASLASTADNNSTPRRRGGRGTQKAKPSSAQPTIVGPFDVEIRESAIRESLQLVTSPSAEGTNANNAAEIGSASNADDNDTPRRRSRRVMTQESTRVTRTAMKERAKPTIAEESNAENVESIVDPTSAGGFDPIVDLTIAGEPEAEAENRDDIMVIEIITPRRRGGKVMGGENPGAVRKAALEEYLFNMASGSNGENIESTIAGGPGAESREYTAVGDALDEHVEDCIVVKGKEEDYVDVVEEDEDEEVVDVEENEAGHEDIVAGEAMEIDGEENHQDNISVDGMELDEEAVAMLESMEMGGGDMSFREYMEEEDEDSSVGDVKDEDHSTSHIKNETRSTRSVFEVKDETQSIHSVIEPNNETGSNRSATEVKDENRSIRSVVEANNETGSTQGTDEDMKTVMNFTIQYPEANDDTRPAGSNIEAKTETYPTWAPTEVVVKDEPRLAPSVIVKGETRPSSVIKAKDKRNYTWPAPEVAKGEIGSTRSSTEVKGDDRSISAVGDEYSEGNSVRASMSTNYSAGAIRETIEKDETDISGADSRDTSPKYEFTTDAMSEDSILTRSSCAWTDVSEVTAHAGSVTGTTDGGNNNECDWVTTDSEVTLETGPAGGIEERSSTRESDLMTVSDDATSKDSSPGSVTGRISSLFQRTARWMGC